MRLLAYFHHSQDPFELRARLRALGHSVAMRDGGLWRSESRPESGWDAVHAPLFPGIAQAYVAAGVPAIEIDGTAPSLPAPPARLAALPRAAVVTILCPGLYLRDELAATEGPAGAIIGVNEAVRVLACDWQLCNDGFTDAKFQGALGNPGRITRARFANTIPTGSWFALDDIGITEGTWSVICALNCAVAMGAGEVHLYGHDLVPGNGVDDMTSHWDASQAANCGGETAAAIAAVRAVGVRVIHHRWVDGRHEADDGAARVVTLPKRKKGK